MCRRFFDAFSLPLIQNLCGSTDERLAAIAAKAEKESRYHLRRSQEWMLRLGGEPMRVIDVSRLRLTNSGPIPTKCSKRLAPLGLVQEGGGRSG